MISFIIIYFTCRVLPEDSYFKPSQIFNCVNDDYSPEICICDENRHGKDDKILCGFPEDEFLDADETSAIIRPVVMPQVEETCRSTRGKRKAGSTGYSDELVNAHDFFNYTFDDGSTFMYKEVDWPTKSGITEAQAREACENEVQNSLSYNICISKVKADIIITSCVEDIKVNICRMYKLCYVLLNWIIMNLYL